jgi:prephenate dehydrogenase
MTVAVVGMGLMGGSLALGLKGKCRAVVGLDRDPVALARAEELNAADRFFDDPAEGLPGADLIIPAAPVRAILSLLECLPRWVKDPVVLLDVGSTKRQIVAAMSALPPNFDPVGGHPMCGKEHATIEHADPHMFRDAAFALVCTPRTSARAEHVVEALARALGSRPLWMGAEDHDQGVAYTSHLPYLVSSLLSAMTPEEAHPLAGPGLKGMARLSGSSVEMMLDILMTNRGLVLGSLEDFTDRLHQLAGAIRDGEESVLRLLEEGRAGWSALMMSEVSAQKGGSHEQ